MSSEQITSQIEVVEQHPNPITIKEINDVEFWQGLTILGINSLKKPIEYLLEQFGTKEPCNRFDVGNSIEFIIGDYIKSCGFKVLELPNAKRFDIYIYNYTMNIAYYTCFYGNENNAAFKIPIL